MPSTNLEAILHFTDYTEDSRTALLYAAKLALDHHAQLVVLHVVDTLGPERVTYGEAVSQLQPEGYRRRLWTEFQSRVSLPSSLKDVELVLREGDPVEAIVHTAAERGCNLIVLAGHKRAGLEHWLFRGTAEKVLGRAACPVLVVRTSEKPPLGRKAPVVGDSCSTFSRDERRFQGSNQFFSGSPAKST